MAISKSGGTRAYIRGRVGSDVYSIGKTAKGKKQQVVRSLAETVANPQTEAQMFGRMIMSTVMQTVAALRPIIDHSFDGITGRQANISEFISRNYALVKADAIAHPSSGNKFGLNKYQEKGVLQGQYVVSSGSLAAPSAVTLNYSTAKISVALSQAEPTVADLKAALNIDGDDFFTLLGITPDKTAMYARLNFKSSVSDTTAITAGNVGTLFDVEGTMVCTFAFADGAVTISGDWIFDCCGVIYSKKSGEGWIHNTCTLKNCSGVDSNANTALPTYPTGTEQFLNGGDIF